MTNGFHKDKETTAKTVAKKPEAPKRPPAECHKKESDAR